VSLDYHSGSETGGFVDKARLDGGTFDPDDEVNTLLPPGTYSPTQGRLDSMELGFETVGNATLICHDSGPVLVTDPWLGGSAYFGSWGLSHAIPEAQVDHVRKAQHVWISHGHPDHLHFPSLSGMENKQFFVADHVGRRIAEFLTSRGFRTTVMKDRQWYNLSPRIRIQSLAHFNQDSILLVELDRTLIVNLNDCPSTVWQSYISRLAPTYDRSVLLKLNAFGDADMINVFNEAGRRIPPVLNRGTSLGRRIAQQMKLLGTQYAVPFSSLHQYQRGDSAWANEYTAKSHDYHDGFDPSIGELLPAFVAYDQSRDAFTALQPEPIPIEPKDPLEFGDNWDETLSSQDVGDLDTYIKQRPMLSRRLDFLRFVVGGEERVYRWSSRERDGITFEVPRGSLMTAVRNQVFDDLLIGNFMKATLHGSLRGLYPAVSPYVGKWADNGRAVSRGEARKYLFDYVRRAPAPTMTGLLEQRVRDAVTAHLGTESMTFEVARNLNRRRRV
jgi:hypothetical protein